MDEWILSVLGINGGEYALGIAWRMKRGQAEINDSDLN
jgi:hypothetical protein